MRIDIAFGIHRATFFDRQTAGKVIGACEQNIRIAAHRDAAAAADTVGIFDSSLSRTDDVKHQICICTADCHGTITKRKRVFQNQIFGAV